MADKREKDAIEESAKLLGLHRLYKEASTNAINIFSAAPRKMKESDEHMELLRHAFGSTAHPRFFRTRKLWDWTDGSFLKRLNAFTVGLNLIFRSEMARLKDAKKS